MTILLVIGIIIGVLVAIILLLKNYFKNEEIELSEIEEEDKRDMITLMGLDFIKETIEIQKIEIPKVYNNIFYRVYFSIYTHEDLIANDPSRFQSNALHLSFEKLGITEETIEYSCTISSYEKTGNALIKTIHDKYLAINKKKISEF